MMEKREKASNFLTILFFFLLIFVFLQFLAPLTQPTSSLSDLSGMTVFEDNEQYWSTMDHPWQDIYRIGDVLCHTKSTRSFYLNQNQIPFCARCTAIWIGLTFGTLFLVFFRIKNQFLFFIGLITSISLLGVDGVGQLLDLWESTNLIRLMTGLLVGLFTGMAIGLIVDELEIFKRGLHKNKKKKGK